MWYIRIIFRSIVQIHDINFYTFENNDESTYLKNDPYCTVKINLTYCLVIIF